MGEENGLRLGAGTGKMVVKVPGTMGDSTMCETWSLPLRKLGFAQAKSEHEVVGKRPTEMGYSLLCLWGQSGWGSGWQRMPRAWSEREGDSLRSCWRRGAVSQSQKEAWGPGL